MLMIFNILSIRILLLTVDCETKSGNNFFYLISFKNLFKEGEGEREMLLATGRLFSFNCDQSITFH